MFLIHFVKNNSFHSQINKLRIGVLIKFETGFYKSINDVKFQMTIEIQRSETCRILTFSDIVLINRLCG